MEPPNAARPMLRYLVPKDEREKECASLSKRDSVRTWKEVDVEHVPDASPDVDGAAEGEDEVDVDGQQPPEALYPGDQRFHERLRRERGEHQEVTHRLHKNHAY